MRGLASKYPLDHFRRDSRSYEEMVFDSVYTSARISGNGYDRLGVDTLLRQGLTAGGKPLSDAIMLLNVRNGFGRAMAVEADTDLDADWLCELHRVLMKDLLPAHEQGMARTSVVAEDGAADAHPAAEPAQLRAELQAVLTESDKYTDPFERAIHLHCNLACLQFFRDGNRRAARLMQTAVLVQAGVLPLFFIDSLIDKYQRALASFEKEGDYVPYVAFFKESYEAAVAQLLGAGQQPLSEHEAKEIRHRFVQLPDLAGRLGAAQTFWLLAKDAIRAQGTPEQVNWADIERRAIVEAIAELGQSPEEIGAVICRYSPGAATIVKQQTILDDIKRLTPELQAQYAKAHGD